jgi:hypothetical protein
MVWVLESGGRIHDPPARGYCAGGQARGVSDRGRDCALARLRARPRGPSTGALRVSRIGYDGERGSECAFWLGRSGSAVLARPVWLGKERMT